MTRILIVDDDDQIRKDLVSHLSSKNYECIEATELRDFINIIGAIECGEERPVDLILLDHQLPPVYGWDLLEEVRKLFGEDCCRYKFVVCTANPDAQLNARYQRLGSISHIVKPYSVALHSFWNTIEAALIDPRHELFRGSSYWDTISLEKQADIRINEFHDARALLDYERVYRIATNWIVYYAEKNDYESIINVLNSLHDLLNGIEKIVNNNLENYFDVFESLVPYSIDNSRYRDLIADKYLMIAFKAIDVAYFKNKPISKIIRNIRLYLRNYFPSCDKDLTAYIDDKFHDKKLVDIEYCELIELPSTEEEEWSQISFVKEFCIGLAGGHKSVRASIIAVFSNYPYLKFVEVPSSREMRVDTSYVKERLYRCDLIVMITGYTGHDLTRNIMTLHRTKGLKGDILTPKCHGSSGLTREIQNAIMQLI